MSIRRLLVAPLLAMLVLVGAGVTPAEAAETSARTLLGRLTVAGESGGSTYDRDRFKHWTDNNGDCQNTRAEVLLNETRATVTFTTSRRCTVATGRWYSYYDGKTWTQAGDVDIDHLVALKEAWESGARSWSAGDRTRFANDMVIGASLAAVTDNVNSSKGERDPADWLPPRSSVHCKYAIQWVQVKYRWRLRINAAEKSALASIIRGDCGDRSVTVPQRAL
jgi:hypothetical protein